MNANIMQALSNMENENSSNSVCVFWILYLIVQECKRIIIEAWITYKRNSWVEKEVGIENGYYWNGKSNALKAIGRRESQIKGVLSLSGIIIGNQITI